MIKKIFLFLVLMSIFSCEKKSLDLPQVAVSGIGEIQNHSEVWVFEKHDTNSIKAEINKNNTIGSTHWIVNIDKHLPLSEVIPVIQMVKKKRAKKSPHSVEGMHTYLSYSDLVDKKIALFPIDSIQYMSLKADELSNIEKLNEVDKKIKFLKDSIVINTKVIPREKWKYVLFDTLENKKIQLYFSNTLSYQDYMKYRLELQNKLQGIPVNNLEFILQE